MTRIFLLIILTSSALTATARNFADQLDSRANVTVTQPASLRARLASSRIATEAETGSGETISAPASSSTSTTAGGYRVQVFSDNNPRTAKREAQSKAAALSETFPQWATYLTFDSPYWRLRVGDFRTYEDATQAVVELKNAFPAWRRELRVVRDRIKVTD
ncbi:MAG: SPOR domain-containing protein [Muribaculaceae bacterium]|nr:SPOR domain-containing protein [Muribaculaceae bacterium]MDE6314869.1 SPOR domain-containing protein [Muribaculaceae bacterium]